MEKLLFLKNYKFLIEKLIKLSIEKKIKANIVDKKPVKKDRMMDFEIPGIFEET